jgi:hypothetical protein
MENYRIARILYECELERERERERETSDVLECDEDISFKIKRIVTSFIV